MWKLNFEPVRGCSPVDRGCENCTGAALFHKNRWREGFGGFTRQEGRRAPPQWTGRVVVDESKLVLLDTLPKGLGTLWVCPDTDLFHENVPDEFLKALYDKLLRVSEDVVIWITTKRSARMRAILDAIDFPGLMRPNICHGVSISSEADVHRIVDLSLSKAGARYIEYLGLGPIDWRQILEGGGYGLVIGRGEEGAGAAPSNPWLFRELRDTCELLGIRFMFAGWGEHLPFDQVADDLPIMDLDHWPISVAVDPDEEMPANRVGAKRSGRLLDGETHIAVPKQGGVSV
jgi:protein gp37